MTVDDVKTELSRLFPNRAKYFDVREHRFEVGQKPKIKITLRIAGDLIIGDHDDCGILFRHELKGLMVSAQAAIINELGSMIRDIDA